MTKTRYLDVKENQLSMDEELFGSEWVGMPEFVQNKQEAHAEMIIRFSSENDLQEFAELINQKLTNKTKSLWYPELERGFHGGKVYVEKP
jgi:hypothetical protein